MKRAKRRIMAHYSDAEVDALLVALMSVAVQSKLVAKAMDLMVDEMRHVLEVYADGIRAIMDDDVPGARTVN